MKKLCLIMAGLLLSVVLAACSVLEQSTAEKKTIAAHLHTLKTKGCEALPDHTRRLLVILIKSRLSVYPDNGICNPDWVRDVLFKKIDVLEADSVHDRSTRLGYQANSRHRYMDKPDGTCLLLGSAEAGNSCTDWVCNRSGINSEKASLVYASCILRDPGGSSNSRLLLHTLVSRNDEEAGRFSLARSNGARSYTGTNVETEHSLLSSQSWRQG